MSAGPVLPGLETARAQAPGLRGLRVGYLTNPTGASRDLRHGVEHAEHWLGVKIARLFAPEHGLRGGLGAAICFGDGVDASTQLPIVSLHGERRRPLPEHLEELDAVVYDIQDVGHRAYTYISSLALMIEACAEAGVELWVLDRPDPLGGATVGGPMLDEDLRSFIGIHNVAQNYGLTPGEFARLYAAERAPDAAVRVVTMQGWRRGMSYGETGWAWIPPSEHIPHWETCRHYAMTGTLGELGIVSNGVGTPQPFELIGAPWIDAFELAAALNENFKRRGDGGVAARAAQFHPRYGTHAGEACGGVQLHASDGGACNPAAAGQTILITLSELYRERGLFTPTAPSEPEPGRPGPEPYGLFLKALGSRAFADALARGGPFDEVEASLDVHRTDYLKRREAFLLYE